MWCDVAVMWCGNIPHRTTPHSISQNMTAHHISHGVQYVVVRCGKAWCVLLHEEMWCNVECAVRCGIMQLWWCDSIVTHPISHSPHHIMHHSISQNHVVVWCGKAWCSNIVTHSTSHHSISQKHIVHHFAFCSSHHIPHHAPLLVTSQQHILHMILW